MVMVYRNFFQVTYSYSVRLRIRIAPALFPQGGNFALSFHRSSVYSIMLGFRQLMVFEFLWTFTISDPLKWEARLFQLRVICWLIDFVEYQEVIVILEDNGWDNKQMTEFYREASSPVHWTEIKSLIVFAWCILNKRYLVLRVLTLERCFSTCKWFVFLLISFWVKVRAC